MLVTRDSMLVKSMCDRGIKLTGSAYVSDISDKDTRKGTKINLMLSDIEFEHSGKQYEIEHCWLQQVDYPTHMKRKAEIGELYYIEFTFYPYRDAIDRGMHGMDVSFMEVY